MKAKQRHFSINKNKDIFQLTKNEGKTKTFSD